MRDIKYRILWYAIKYHGEWSKIGNALQKKEEYQRIEQYPYSYVTIEDTSYPAVFKQLRYPPWILFYKGNLDLVNQPMAGIVGSRLCSIQALRNTETVVNVLKKKYVIVSGLAKGIDAKAHQCSLDKGTVGIIGCGIDRVYPKENEDLFQKMEKDHCILSEYPCGVPPLKYHFPWRNRLIAACSQLLVVIEAKKRSGTMLTVNECIDLSVPVYCLPTAFENKEYDGCNYLITNGAYLLELNELENL